MGEATGWTSQVGLVLLGLELATVQLPQPRLQPGRARGTNCCTPSPWAFSPARAFGAWLGTRRWMRLATAQRQRQFGAWTDGYEKITLITVKKDKY